MPLVRTLSILLLFLFMTLPRTAWATVFNAESFVLDNGLRVVVIPNHRAPVVTHMVWYHFGGGDEKPGESGVAHFLEHLMFKGTPSVPDGAFSKTVKKMGGNDNAFTTRDYTAYYQNIPRQHLSRVMEMEADRMKNLVLREEEVLSERQVIIEERRQRVDNQPQSLFQEQLMSVLYVNHPYSTPVIGWMHEIEKLTQQQAMDYYKRLYAPNNAIVIVSGDVGVAEMKELAEKYYGELAAADIPQRTRPHAAPLLAARRITMSDPRVGLPVVMKTWRAPRGSDALDLFSEIAGGTSTARLYKALVVDQKLAVSAGMQYDPLSLNETSLTVYASPAPGVTIDALETALDTVLQDIRQIGVTAEELDAARGRKKASLIYYLDSLQGPAMLFGRALASGFDMSYVENWTQRMDKLRPADINAAARAVFSSGDQPVTGILLPEEHPE